MSDARRTLACLTLMSVLITACSNPGAPRPGPSEADAEPTQPTITAAEDPYLWLEEVDSARALDWVRSQNEGAVRELIEGPEFGPLRDRLRAILDSDERIPAITMRGGFVYNFWRDRKNVRGVWRRTTLDDYLPGSPTWDVIIDLDQLAASEGQNWVWRGADCLYPQFRQCLISLSVGGADAIVVREYDLETRQFVADGFSLPEAKTQISWIDPNTVYVGTDFGPGSMTSSGYPRVVKRWQRGQPLAEAATVYEGTADDVWVAAVTSFDHGHRRELIYRGTSFYTNLTLLMHEGEFLLLDKPEDAEVSFFDQHLLVQLRKAWTVGPATHPAGALLAIPVSDFLAGKRDFAVIYEPGPRKSLSGFSATKTTLLVRETEEVRPRLYAWHYTAGQWIRRQIAVPDNANVGVAALDENLDDRYLITVSSPVQPTTQYLAEVGSDQRQLIRQLPAFFDTSGLTVSQHHAQSKDGTRIPYFQIARSGLPTDGSTPTLLYGYGGFEVPLEPAYSATVGAGWLERGGVYVMANIRGGGEFGPAWHQAALKENRQRAYEDFIAVAEDLIARGITSPGRLGIQGGSNGGLLMGAMLTQRPDLFGAVVCQVPLLDMRRYHLLLAGASWMAEYGNPDLADEWAYISRYSPYQNVHADRTYPPVLFTTSTRDDRVHPGHARKMAARMTEQGHRVWYYENIEGGHGGAANSEQQAHISALAYQFLWQQIGG